MRAACGTCATSGASRAECGANARGLTVRLNFTKVAKPPSLPTRQPASRKWVLHRYASPPPWENESQHNWRSMAGERSGSPVASHWNRWPTAIASLAVGAAFFALWFWLLPRWLGFNVDAGVSRWRWLAAIPSVLGFAVALRCVGFWLDGARHACTHRPAAAIGGGGLLPPRSESDVPPLRSGLDRALGRVRASQPGDDRRRGDSRSWRASFRGLV